MKTAKPISSVEHLAKFFLRIIDVQEGNRARSLNAKELSDGVLDIAASGFMKAYKAAMNIDEPLDGDETEKLAGIFAGIIG